MKNQGTIAAGHQKTAQAGLEMFELGGNAFDAAVAAALASCVVESTLTSVGGGGFLLAHTWDRRNILFDFFGHTPLQKKPGFLDFYAVPINFGDTTQDFHVGLGSVATPGNLAGLFRVQQQLGRLPFQAVVEPAIHYATTGFTINSFQGFCHRLLEPILTRTQEGKDIYAPQGKLLQSEDICYMPALADILTEISTKGIDLFYRGDLAHQICRDMEHGGYLTISAFNKYRVREYRPLQIDYRGYQLLTNPPPSSGGTLIAFALKMLENVDFQGIEFGSKQHLEILARIMQVTNLARVEGYDQNIYREDISETFLNDANLDRYRINKWGSTNHISVIDREGNAASITTTNGEGSAYIVPNTGIMLNNMLGEADLNPLGFHRWQCDRRISSMMSPTIILKDGKPEIVLGSGGSNRIRTAIFQVISNLIDFRQPLDNAVQNSRVHWEAERFHIEPPINTEINSKTLDTLQLPESTITTFWQNKNMFFGGVNVVRYRSDGVLEGVGDLRRGGVALSN